MIRHEATAAYSNITILEDRVSALDNSHNNLAFQLNSIEQYLKEWNILIHGLQNLPVRPSDPEGRNSYEFIFIEHICQVLNELLGDKLYKQLHPNDIERAHILYQGTKQGKPVVIVRFVRRVVRNNVFFCRKNLKGTKVSISDHLSKHNLSVLKEAKRVFGPDNTWSSMSKIFISAGGRSHSVKSFNDIYRIADRCIHDVSRHQPPPAENLEELNVADHLLAQSLANNSTGNHACIDAVVIPAPSIPAAEDITSKSSGNQATCTALLSSQDKKMPKTGSGRKSLSNNNYANSKHNRLKNSRLTPKADLRYNK